MKTLTKLTIFQVADLRETLLTEVATDKMKITIDLQDLQECDVAGLQLLLSFMKTASDTGKEIKLTNAPGYFLETVKAVGLDLNSISLS